jgi:uncharacterized protein YqjF (DUF2071 family)
MVALLEMTWRDTLFAHWPVEPAVVAERLPDGLTVDTYDGRAYLGVVPFEMADLRPRGSPVGLSFGELNLRTYVRQNRDADADGDGGVYFFNLDADDRLGVTVARSLFRLPYYRARMRVDRHGGSVRFRSRRSHPGQPALSFDAEYRPEGEAFTAEPGGLASFLVERYRFFTADDDGRLWAGDIEHEPWRLRGATATFARNDCFGANGFERPPGDPHLLYAESIDVRVGRVRRVGPADRAAGRSDRTDRPDHLNPAGPEREA